MCGDVDWCMHKHTIDFEEFLFVFIGIWWRFQTLLQWKLCPSALEDALNQNTHWALHWASIILVMR